MRSILKYKEIRYLLSYYQFLVYANFFCDIKQWLINTIKNLKFYQLCKYLSLIEFRNIVEEVLILPHDYVFDI